MPVAPLETLDVNALRRSLSAVVPAPMSFVRRIGMDVDKALFVERLTQPLPVTDDLRFVYKIPHGPEIAVLAQRLPWDSSFFGYGVARLEGMYPLQLASAATCEYGPAVTALLDLAATRGVTYLFAIVDARDLATLRALGEAGFSLIETRLYYHRELEGYAHAERYAVRRATAADVESLEHTARDTINAFDRFHADPFISRVEADRMMCMWVRASILDGFADVTVVPDVPEPKAFCTVRYHKDNWERWGIRLAQPIFSAVGPEFKGWYKKLISEISYHLKEHGAQHAFMTTQATNSVVVWTWESLGYRYGKTEHTFAEDPPSIDVTNMTDPITVGATAALTRVVTSEDVAAFDGITGDSNPLHTDDEAARACGFRARIAQGMLVAGHISAVLGTLLPGPGSIYLRQTLSFKAPVYIGDRITAAATVVDVRADKPIITLKTSCTNQNNQLVIEGEAVILRRTVPAETNQRAAIT